MEDASEEHSRKRRKLSNGDDHLTESRSSHSHLPKTLTSSIFPPPLRRIREPSISKMIDSPFQLTWIRDLPESSNVGAVSLKDILGDPLIAECWDFNYLHDIDFLMDAFDLDTKDFVHVHVIHGFWKQEDRSRQNLKVFSVIGAGFVIVSNVSCTDFVLQLQAKRYPNVELLTAFMPEMFGTHHTKVSCKPFSKSSRT